MHLKVFKAKHEKNVQTHLHVFVRFLPIFNSAGNQNKNTKKNLSPSLCVAVGECLQSFEIHYGGVSLCQPHIFLPFSIIIFCCFSPLLCIWETTILFFCCCVQKTFFSVDETWKNSIQQFSFFFFFFCRKIEK